MNTRGGVMGALDSGLLDASLTVYADASSDVMVAVTHTVRAWLAQPGA